MELGFENVSEVMELSEGNDVVKLNNQLAEYEAQLQEAQQQGLSAAENYYKNKIAHLNSELGSASSDGRDELGSEPFPEIKQHRDAAMNYERQANALEDKIRRGKESESKRSEVARLRSKAQEEYRKMRQAQQFYRPQPVFRGAESNLGTHQGAETDSEIGTHQGKESGEPNADISTMKENAAGINVGQELSFGGGMGASEIEHMRGSSMVSEANSKRSTAATLESDARRARSAGDTSKAASLESRAHSLRSEANSLEAKGKKLMS